MESKLGKIENYLACHIDNMGLIIEQVLLLTPDSYFYTPEITQGSFQTMRDRMNEIKQKQRFSAYRNDKGLKSQYRILFNRYTSDLAQLSVRKRQALMDELLTESLEMQTACMISLIRRYDLLKHLRTFS